MLRIVFTVVFLIFSTQSSYAYEDNFCLQQNQKIGDKVEQILSALAHDLRNNIIDITFYEKWFRVMNDFYDYNVKVQIRKAAYYDPSHCIEIANMALSYYDDLVYKIMEDFNEFDWQR